MSAAPERSCRREESVKRVLSRGEDEGGASFYLHRSLVPLEEAVIPDYVPGAAGEGVGCSPYSCVGDTLASVPHAEQPSLFRREVAS